MPRLSVLLFLLTASLGLAACQQAGSGAADDAPVANAVLGGEIEVTALDDPAPDAPMPDVPMPDAPMPDGAQAPDAAPDTLAGDAADSVAEAADAPGDAPAADAEAVVPPAEPEVQKSEAQISCEKKRGVWTRLGNTRTATCVRITKDSGQSCTRESQCESRCLARSGTCSPFDPMLGCNEILQDNGARVTLCIE